MINYNAIKDIIVNKLGLKDLTAYKQYMESWVDIKNPKIITKKDVELLSPDNINNFDFWKIAEELFGVDGISNTDFGKNNTFDRDEANRRNLIIARASGVLNMIDVWKHSNASVLEIGAGYGNFKNYVLYTTALTYTGVDAFPKVPGIIPTLPNGLLPDEIKQKKFNLVYSSNVFQHLSSSQRRAYLNDVHGMLHNGGYFMFNLFLTLSRPKFPSEDGKNYTQLYGQFTEIPTYREFTNLISEYYWVDFETRRFSDDFITFVCRPKDLIKTQEPV